MTGESVDVEALRKSMRHAPGGPWRSTVLALLDALAAATARAEAAEAREAALRAGETRVEWGVRRQFPGWSEYIETCYTGMDGWTTGPYDEAEALRLSRSGGQYGAAVSRTITTFRDVVTEWIPVNDGTDT